METSSAATPTPEMPGIRHLRGKNLSLVSERTAAQTPLEQELKAALATVRTAFAILGSRALVILTALGAAAAFGWALWTADGWRIAAACLFTAMVFWPALWVDRH